MSHGQKGVTRVENVKRGEAHRRAAARQQVIEDRANAALTKQSDDNIAAMQKTIDAENARVANEQDAGAPSKSEKKRKKAAAKKAKKKAKKKR